MTTATFQTDSLDNTYNGYSNYETWNVCLWINNTESLYRIAQNCGCYQEFLDFIGDDAQTGDGVVYSNSKINTVQVNSNCFDFFGY